MFTSVLVTLALSASAFATVSVTEPVLSTTWSGGQQATLSWKDDNTTPSLQSFGPSIVSIYTGNRIQQTSLQTIASNVDVSTTASIQFTPNPSIGPNGADYFIRFESLSLKDATTPQYPALAFSSKFTMNNMSGTFNATVQAQIDGQSTAPISSPTGATSSGSSASASATTAKSSSSAKASGSATSSAANASASNGASGLTVAGFTAFTGVVAAIVGNALF
ncbi:hypothetical protein PLICRDRAFT_173503 [Plicaturopsis crispa FD-325 SS-3]|nr:hypothetical protein PLICRDRAFT_173503 [Plicaturopsis crispa FD-325 SS-3]